MEAMFVYLRDRKMQRLKESLDCWGVACGVISVQTVQEPMMSYLCMVLFLFSISMKVSSSC